MLWKLATDEAACYPGRGRNKIQLQLGVDTGDCNILQHNWQLTTGNAIARKLPPNDGRVHAEHQPVSSALGLEENTNVEEGRQGPTPLNFGRLGGSFYGSFYFETADGMDNWHRR